jgi:hypothetical protein
VHFDPDRWHRKQNKSPTRKRGSFSRHKSMSNDQEEIGHEVASEPISTDLVPVNPEPGAIDISESQLALMQRIDDWVSHVWMVRAFLKHSDEAAEDDDLAEVHRGLYDFMLALGPSLEARDADRYLKIARKKMGKLRAATQSFHELQPEISGHMNFRMAAKSLTIAVEQIRLLVEQS